MNREFPSRIFSKIATVSPKLVVRNIGLLSTRDRLILDSPNHTLASGVHGRLGDNPIIQSAASSSERPTKRVCMASSIASDRNSRRRPKRNSSVCLLQSANKKKRLTEAQADELAAIDRLRLNRNCPLLPSDAPT